MTSVEKRTQKKFLNIIDVDFGLIWNYLNTSLVELALAVRLKKYKRFFSFPFFFCFLCPRQMVIRSQALLPET